MKCKNKYKNLIHGQYKQNKIQSYSGILFIIKMFKNAFRGGKYVVEIQRISFGRAWACRKRMFFNNLHNISSNSQRKKRVKCQSRQWKKKKHRSLKPFIWPFKEEFEKGLHLHGLHMQQHIRIEPATVKFL